MSGTVRFISDPHFGHRNMAIRRGFKDEFVHDEHIIERWNNIVRKKDTTWILGDITMHKATNYNILDRLNGFKRVVLGNHDEGNHAKHLLNHVNSIHGMAIIKSKEFGKIFLTHCPIHPREFEYRIDYNIHGHIHDNTINDRRYINVSMEAVDYKPKELTQLMQKR